MMRTHRCAISGSLALYFFDLTLEWAPADMDLYMPQQRRQRVVRYLTAEGYTPVQRADIHHSEYNVNCGIADVVTMCNSACTINVVVAAGRTCIAPIFCFHTTAVMNFLSADVFFCAYPTLTTSKKALCNPIAYSDGWPTTALALCYTKYANRGYSVRMNP
ncbi:hypothetical protein BV22DRAFT_984209, partial [Leucogyrophana mollusca]